MSRVFIIHGWGGSPTKDWIPWVVEMLRMKGYEVITPAMPSTDSPNIEGWVNKLKEVVGIPQENDILIGHSIGCQTILRFLENLEDGSRVRKVILVAPWLKLENLSSDEEWKIAEPWLHEPIEFNAVRPKADSFVAIFSSNDLWVPLKENVSMFTAKLQPKIIIKNNKGHFSEDDGVTELPEILDLL